MANEKEPRFFRERLALLTVLPADECWTWRWTLTRYGYARVYWRGLRTSGHRVAYELLAGPIPPGMDLDHLCRNRACVNPAHMEPVTRAINVLRGNSAPAKNARKTHCAEGHPLGEGRKRPCRICAREKIAAKRAADPEGARAQWAADRARNRERRNRRARERWALRKQRAS